MKKFRYIIAAVFVVAIGTAIFIGCEKENYKVNNNINTQKSLDIDFSAISVQNGMLCFNSWEHYQTVLESLTVACEEYTDEYFIQLNNELGGNIDMETLSDTANARGFSQFTPLHEFCDSLNFNSLYLNLESEEIQWMNTENATIITNPFYNTYFDRYESALHNIYGDVKIGDSIFNPSDAIQKITCYTKGFTPLVHDFTYNGDKEMCCKLKGAVYQCHASFTYYKIKNNGKRAYAYGTLNININGNVGDDCSENSSTSAIESNMKEKNNACYIQVYSWRSWFPAYLINEVHSRCSQVDADVDVILSL
jgi:hypothetical protein